MPSYAVGHAGEAEGDLVDTLLLEVVHHNIDVVVRLPNIADIITAHKLRRANGIIAGIFDVFYSRLLESISILVGCGKDKLKIRVCALAVDVALIYLVDIAEKLCQPLVGNILACVVGILVENMEDDRQLVGVAAVDEARIDIVRA